MDPKPVDTEEWPESLIKAETAEAEEAKTNENVIPFRVENNIDFTAPDTDDVDVVIDNLVEDDALRIRSSDSASRFIDVNVATDKVEGKTSTLPYVLMMFMGSILFGGGIAEWFKNKGEIK